mmetsp:Transcript_50763/g.164162  ORF Transcript_50763/g.164162 Transcript_50763/m.164162 type:complete len:382 (-) Transcript_50763:80-1225(-)|eukprot:CAMPEP_0203939460 /NCGR_PEP_ID=MMETSP0359-20131031/76239_1 /ASSEMBLY_ACC=CAM_ASM_000338 /TAXON_ID=268821 /ORGANISM="Scrippsiella Hangoei, Strain SHTV-5" /LENGTH=381 /DNA_ID=CAMNT_0050869777 /DNA_START=43 /DNA_END=1188 /DNA_ORIENTATION=-
MAPTKRQSTSGAGAAAAKRGRKADADEAKKAEAIAEAVRGAEGVPAAILGVLANAVKVSLGACKDVRHAFAEQYFGMVDEVLKASEASAREQDAALEAKVAASGAERAAREATAEAAAAAAAELAVALEQTKGQLATASGESSAAKAALQAVEAEQKSGDEAHTAAAERKQTLEQAFGGDYEVIKQTTDAKLLKAVMKVVQGFGFDSALVSYAEETFGKPAGERGTFDGLVVRELDQAFKAAIEEVDAELSQGEPEKAARAAQVDAARADAIARAEAEETCKGEVSAAQAAFSEAQAIKKSAEKSLKDFAPEMKRVASELVSAKKDLRSRESILASFLALRERTTPPPPEPEPVEEEPVAKGAEAGGAVAEETAVPEVVAQ